MEFYDWRETGADVETWQLIYSAAWAGIDPRELAGPAYGLTDDDWRELIIIAYIAKQRHEQRTKQD